MLGGPPHPAIVTIGDNGDHIRSLLLSYYTTMRVEGPPRLCVTGKLRPQPTMARNTHIGGQQHCQVEA